MRYTQSLSVLLSAFSLLLLVLWPAQAAEPERIGIYSGTFDPPHIGHQALLELAHRELQLTGIYILPNYSPDHKPGATPFAQRYALVKAWQQTLPFVDLPPASLLQTVWQQSPEDPMGTLLNWISTQHPQNSHYFQLMGTDSFNKLVAYHKLPRAGEKRTVVVIDRPGYTAQKTLELEALIQSGQLIWLNGRLPEISSSQLRKELNSATHCQPSITHLPLSVQQYICQQKMYLEQSHCQALLCGSR